jgi:hypothetical protein
MESSSQSTTANPEELVAPKKLISRLAIFSIFSRVVQPLLATIC